MAAQTELEPYFHMLDFEPCEYSFMTVYMWQHVYKTRYEIRDGYALIIGEYENEPFCMAPLAKKEDYITSFKALVELFEENKWKFIMRAAPKEFKEIIEGEFGDVYEIIEERDYFDYVYLGSDLRVLEGKNYQKKRNHIRGFLKEYGDRYEYRILIKEDYDEVVALIDEWIQLKLDQSQVDEGMFTEKIAILNTLQNSDHLPMKIAGIFVDNKLEAFTIGEAYRGNTVVIHVEKANASIRGLYPYINQAFLIHEYPDVEFVNREEDLGSPGLRKAKLSYYPERLIEKYTIMER